MQPRNNQSIERGFALLITLMVVSVVVSVTLAIVELSLKQLELSVDSTDSELAFQAANAGLECARRTRNRLIEGPDFENGSTVTFECFDASPENVDSAVPGTLDIAGISAPDNGDVYWYEVKIPFGSAPVRCSEMRVVSMVVDASATAAGVTIGSASDSLSNYLPGYPGDVKNCGPGGRCTAVSVTGYSSDCDAANLVKASTRSREILLEF